MVDMPGASEREGAPPTWTGLLDFLAQGLDHHGTLPVFLRVMSGRFWSDFRVLRRLPVTAAEVSADTREVRLLVPGLNRANPIGAKAASLEQLLQQLRAAAEVASTFKLVLSDELALDRTALLGLATKRGHEWTGPPLDEIEEGEYIGKFDLPLRALQARPRPHHLELLAKVVQ